MKSKKIKLISFDLFGTLVFYNEAYWWLYYLQCFLFNRNFRENLKELKRDSQVMDGHLISLMQESKKFSVVTINFFADFLRDELRSIQFYPDAVNTLVSLQKAGYKIALTSNLAKDFGDKVLKIFPIQPDLVLFSYEIGSRKPEDKIFAELIEKSGFEPEEIIHIGDKFENDYQGAVKHKINPILLDRRGKVSYASEIHVMNSLDKFQTIMTL
jgi:FMN phosphatase YigB (HAD superfamily)